MYKLIALYDQPDDPDSFMAHYTDVHMPLVRKTPGLLKAEASRVHANAMGGTAPYFLVAEMTYADKATFEAAMASAENRAAGKDLMSFARGKVKLLVAETQD
jgi:uncharacterized protein (TIGR02118 family)